MASEITLNGSDLSDSAQNGSSHSPESEKMPISRKEFDS